MWRVLFGNYVLYENERKNLATIRKYTPDYQRDWVDRIPGLRYGALGGLVIFMLMFGWAWGLAAMALHSLFYVLLNASVNSLGHMVGYRNWDNLATNLPALALVTGGEGLHNNHHEFPSAARFSMRRMEIDPAWPVIRALEWLHLARVRCEPLARAVWHEPDYELDDTGDVSSV
jgi:stearoyl-CoA desaturase (delta-9 desaturase)